MKKLLMLLLIALLLALSLFLVIRGISIGNFEILGLEGIQQKNAELDEKIQQAGRLIEKDYKDTIDQLDTNSKKLKAEKERYEQMLALAEDETQITNQVEKYEIETLWVRLGNHATSEGVIMQMDVTKGSGSAKDVYNLKFTATGSYISITDFISGIENDSELGFKIEEFKMVPASSGDKLQATFICRDISIKEVSNTSDKEDTSSSSNKNTNTSNKDKTNTTKTNSKK